MLVYSTQKTIDHFAHACFRAGLTTEWAPRLEAFFLHLDDLFITKAMLRTHWNVITSISNKLGMPLTQHQVTLFNYVLANCKSPENNKLPVI